MRYRRIRAAFAASSPGLRVFAPSAFAVDTVSHGVTAGGRTASFTDLNMNSVAYSHSNQNNTGIMTLTADDSTGSGFGWNVTVQSSAGGAPGHRRGRHRPRSTPAHPGDQGGEARPGRRRLGGRGGGGQHRQVRLRPTAEVVVTDSAGREVSRTKVNMESFYAGMTTSVEASQHRLLEPGRYSVRVTLDYQGGQAEAGALALTAPLGEELAVRPPEGAAGAQGTSTKGGGGGIPTWALFGAAVGLLVLGTLLGTALSAVLR